MNDAQQAKAWRQSELGLRVASAIVLLVIILAVALWGGWLFALVCAVLSVLLFIEWTSMVSTTPFDAPEAIIWAGFAGLVISALVGVLWFALAIFLLAGLVLELATRGRERDEVRWLGLGALYCIIPVAALPMIREVGGLALLLFVFCIVWATDIAAYFAGRRFGGPKLLAAVSPNKTWSGALGGVAAAALTALVFAALVEPWKAVAVFLLAIVLSVVSQAGDLLESGVKRYFGVKDTSQLIPGHGGFLDRVDGLVPVAALTAILVALRIA